MGVWLAAHTSNSANWSNSISTASCGLRSHCALVFLACITGQFIVIRVKNWEKTYALQNLCRPAIGQYPVGKAQSRVVVLAAHRQVHGVKQRQLAMGDLDLGDGKVPRQLETPLQELRVLVYRVLRA